MRALILKEKSMTIFKRSGLWVLLFICMLGPVELTATAPATLTDVLANARNNKVVKNKDAYLNAYLTDSIMNNVSLEDIKSIPVDIVREIPTAKLSKLTPAVALATYRAMCPLFPNRFPKGKTELSFVKWSDIPDSKLNALAGALRNFGGFGADLFKNDANSWLQILWARGCSTTDTPISRVTESLFLNVFREFATTTINKKTFLTNALTRRIMEHVSFDDFLKIPVEAIASIKPTDLSPLPPTVASQILQTLEAPDESSKAYYIKAGLVKASLLLEWQQTLRRITQAPTSDGSMGDISSIKAPEDGDGDSGSVDGRISSVSGMDEEDDGTDSGSDTGDGGDEDASVDTFAKVMKDAAPNPQAKIVEIMTTRLTTDVMETAQLEDFKDISINVVREIPTYRLGDLKREVALALYRAMCPLFPNSFPKDGNELDFVKWSDVPDNNLRALADVLRNTDTNMFKANDKSWLQKLFNRGRSAISANLVTPSLFSNAICATAALKKGTRADSLRTTLSSTHMRSATYDDFLNLPVELVNAIDPVLFSSLQADTAQSLYQALQNLKPGSKLALLADAVSGRKDATGAPVKWMVALKKKTEVDDAHAAGETAARRLSDERAAAKIAAEAAEAELAAQRLRDAATQALQQAKKEQDLAAAVAARKTRRVYTATTSKFATPAASSSATDVAIAGAQTAAAAQATSIIQSEINKADLKALFAAGDILTLQEVLSRLISSGNGAKLRKALDDKTDGTPALIERVKSGGEDYMDIQDLLRGIGFKF